MRAFTFQLDNENLYKKFIDFSVFHFFCLKVSYHSCRKFDTLLSRKQDETQKSELKSQRNQKSMSQEKQKQKSKDFLTVCLLQILLKFDLDFIVV